MRVAPVAEFRRHLGPWIASGELVFLTRHGKLVSILVPLDHPDELPVDLRRELLARLGEAVGRRLKGRAIVEKDILPDFDAWTKRKRWNHRRR